MNPRSGVEPGPRGRSRALPQRRRRRRWLIALLLAVAAIGWGPALLVRTLGPTVAEGWLTGMLDAELEVGTAAGGLWEPLVLGEVELRRHGQALLRIDEVRCDLGLVKLGLSDSPITLEVVAPALRLDPGEPGSLLRALDPLWESDGARIDGDLPAGRPLAMRFEGGVVEVSGTALRYDLGGRSWTELGVSGSVGYDLVLARGAERIESRGSLGIGSAGGADGFLSHTTLQSVPAETLRGLLPPGLGAALSGVITQASLDLSGDEVGTALTARIEGRDVVLHGATVAPWSLADVDLVVRGLIGARRMRLDELVLEGSKVRAALAEPAWIELADAEIAGRLRGTFHLLETPATDSGLLPPGVQLTGSLDGELDFEGSLSLTRDLPILERLTRARAGVKLAAQHADLAGWASGAVDLRLEVTGGTLHLREMRARMGGGTVDLLGDLPLGAKGGAGGKLQWTVDGLAVDRRFPSGETLWLDGLSGGGILSCSERGYRLRGALEFDRLDLEGPNLGGGILSLSDGITDLEAESLRGLDRLEVSLLRVTTAEGRITLEDARVTRGASSWEIRSAAKGECEPLLLDRLLPDWGGRAAAPVHFGGRVAMATGGEAPSGLEGELDLRCDRVRARGRLLTGVRTRIAKVGSRLDLAQSLRFEHAGGNVEVGGHWELANPGAGRLEAAFDAVPVRTALPREGEAAPRELSAVLSGQARATVSPNKRSLEFEGQVQDLRLRVGDREVASLAAGDYAGKVAIGGGAALDVILSLRGGDLDAAIALARAPEPGRGFDFVGRLAGEGGWLDALVPFFDLEGVAASGPVALRCALRGEGDDLLRLDGEAEVAARNLHLAGQELREVQLEASMGAGRLRVAAARARCGDGELTVAGECGLLAAARRTTDRLQLELTGFPIRVVEGEGEGEERISLVTLTGATTVVTTAAHGLEASLDLILDPITRYLKQRGSLVESARLPRLVLGGSLRVDGDLERWHAPELRAEGEGASCILRGLDLRRDGTARSAGDLDVEVTAEVARALLLGYASPHYGIEGPLRLHLSVKREPEGAGFQAEGRIEVETFTLGGIRGAAWNAAFDVSEDRLTLREAELRLGEGSVEVDPGSHVIFAGDRKGAGELRARLSDVRLARQAGRWLGILIPVMLVDPERVPPSELGGLLSGSLQIGGSGGAAGLSGTASLALRDGFVRGSILLESLARKLPQVTYRSLAAAVAEGLGHPRALERALEKAAFDGLRLLPFQIELRMERGEIGWQPGTTLPSSLMNLGLQGTAALGGTLDVSLTTDLLGRVLNASLDHPPPEVPPAARGALRELEGRKLRVRVRGNPLTRDPDGSLAVHVDVLIAR